MAYFPLFQDLSQKKITIFGGGKVAARKAEKLLPFDPEITVIAPEILPELAELPVKTECRPFAEEDISGDLFCVIAATDNRSVNRRIYECCQEKRIPVNTVDDPELCSFLFPSLIRRGPLTVGISTSGASPTAAIWVREQLEDLLPDNTEDILLWLRSQRERIKSAIPTEKARTACQRKLFAACMERGEALDDGTRNAIMKEFTE